jgi:TctA family transporter
VVVANAGGASGTVGAREAKSSAADGCTIYAVWEIFRQPFLLLWATVAGLIIGILAAVGGSASSVMAYDQAKKFSRTP